MKIATEVTSKSRKPTGPPVERATIDRGESGLDLFAKDWGCLLLNDGEQAALDVLPAGRAGHNDAEAGD